MESRRAYRLQDAFCDVLMGLGITAIAFSVVFFLLILISAIPTRGNAYLGLVTAVFLPIIFGLGGGLLYLRRVLVRRLG